MLFLLQLAFCFNAIVVYKIAIKNNHFNFFSFVTTQGKSTQIKKCEKCLENQQKIREFHLVKPF